jgi:hypothetical protein
MALTMHDTHVTPMLAQLNASAKLLDKAAAFCQERKIDESTLLNYRLAPDMFPFTKQIQIMTDMARRMGLVAGEKYPVTQDTETTIEQLKARINAAITFLSGIDAKRYSGGEDREVTLKLGGKDNTMNALHMANSIALPNFFFHASTAYDILRHAGLHLGKRDFLGM